MATFDGLNGPWGEGAITLNISPTGELRTLSGPHKASGLTRGGVARQDDGIVSQGFHLDTR